MTAPEVIIDGHWLSTIMPWGDLEYSTCWPGGTDSITFGVARSHPLFRPDAIVELDLAGTRIAAGTMVEPSRGAPITVEGLYRKAEDYAALEGDEAAIYVNGAVDEAAARGMPFVRAGDLSPEPGVTGSPLLDLDRPHSVARFLDAAAQQRGGHWGVSPTRAAYIAGWIPADIHMLPGVDGLAASRDGYASKLFARFLLDVDGLYHMYGLEDFAATERWGYVERTLSEPLGEGVAMSWDQAGALMQGLLDQGRSKMGWATPIEAQYGDIVNDYNEPVDLHRVFARRCLRLHGLEQDVADLAGQTWVDVQMARTIHRSDGSVLIEPRGLSSPMNDSLAGV